MKTLLVTGASGFLGWNICQKAKLVVDAFNIKYAKLNPCRQREIRMAAPRPLDVSLTHEKARKWVSNQKQ